jgi:hypothetical protein
VEEVEAEADEGQSGKSVEEESIGERTEERIGERIGERIVEVLETRLQAWMWGGEKTLLE